MTIRIELETVKSGQERAYGDTVDIKRLTFTQQGPLDHEYAPTGWFDRDEAKVRAILLAIPCGFIEQTAAQREHGLDSYLAYLKHEDVGVWEFKVVQPYND